MSLKIQLQDQILLLEKLLSSNELSLQVEAAVKCITHALKQDLPLLICGNGGSAADALHISGELVGHFLRNRRALNVICLNSNVSVLTAWSNDFNYESVFSRQVEAHGRINGVLLGISTSGNSANVLQALKKSREIGMKNIMLTGDGGEKISSFSDILIKVPSKITPRIQELHVSIYHYICEQVEQSLAYEYRG